MIKKMEHTAIMASDLDASIDFYTNILGFSLRSRGIKGNRREIAFLFLESDPTHEIELILDLVPLGDYDEKGIVNHLAFRVEDVNLAITYFKDKGITFVTDEPTVSLDGSKTIFLYGPNKELLQLVGN
jgi:lactoylglutathione lyase